ncbi:dimethyl sulfoxide reductase subunit A [Bacillus sp. FJAT-27225]|uniref:DMSO/selenate family reductase complex A subunit n=1 Tax=Bacillus sp. FJAT-27225 TaxID=1743144 RepID=UPI00080C2A2E|nr:DMSO/selenate family reductase complex A subunit [Bacillus sp. FJAT-27225]OCA81501.1 dimethyl sulfoxide reductase subunit A [Bacillus sp. FJAT-27225]
MSDKKTWNKLSRRTFLKWTGALTIPAVAGGLATTNYLKKSTNVPVAKAPNFPEEIIPTCSTFDCGGKCLIKAHVKNGVIVKVSARTNNELDEKNPYMKACVRGRSYRKYQYHPDRLKYPMKRVGKRGEGKFERISWKEAVEIITKETKRITETYGPESRYIHQGTAVTGGSFGGAYLAKRLFGLDGGFLNYYHSVSMGNTAAATPYTYGTAQSGSSLDSLEHTNLVILWGHNPTETIFGNTNHYYYKLKQKGIKFIAVDPRYSDSIAAYADEWIPILPGTDNALMDAMAYVIVKENLHDKAFLDKFVVGFDEEHMPEGVPGNESIVSYLFGKKDGIEKTPEWAEKITKVPASKIRELARAYATARPAALIQGWGPQRHASGERIARGGTMLATITGNVGKLGAWASGYGGIPRKFAIDVPVPENPFKGSISIMSWTDAITDARKITPADGLQGMDKLTQNIKLIYNLAGNYLVNQQPDVNKTIKILEDESLVEFIVVSDHFLTPSAKYADILLPETTFFERWNLGGSWASGDYFMLSEKIVNNYYEARSDYEWMSEVAEGLGIGKEFTENRDELGWIKYILDETRKQYPDTPTFEDLKKNRVHYWRYDGPRVAFKAQIEDPANNKFDTPSGKIELFSKTLFGMKNEEIPAIPKYIPEWEGAEDPLKEKYSLQCITWKGKNRMNSGFYNHPWQQQVAKQVLWINPIDASKRGLKQGDLVKIYNDRGTTMIPAEVTPRIIPGVVAMQAGAWYQPDENGIDRGGCANVLTSQRKTPLAHGNAHQTMLVEVARA